VRTDAERRGGQPGGDDDLAVRPGRPQSVQVGQVGQVIEDQGPGPFGAREPGGEADRGVARVGPRTKDLAKRIAKGDISIDNAILDYAADNAIDALNAADCIRAGVA